MSAITTSSCRRGATRLLQLATLSVIAFAAVVLVILPRATHGVALTVLTGSMTPKIPVGSVVIDRPVDPGTLHVGDVATYQKTAGKAEYITHRIVAINTKTTPTTFIFKGDANRGPDMTPVPASAIRGKVWFHVPYLGAIRDSLQSRGMRATLLVGLMATLALYAGWQAFGAVRDRRKAAAPVAGSGRDVTVTAHIRLESLRELSGTQATTLLRARVVDETPSAYLIALDASAANVETTVQLLRDLSAKRIEIAPVDLTPGLERLRSRSLAASHA